MTARPEPLDDEPPIEVRPTTPDARLRAAADAGAADVAPASEGPPPAAHMALGDAGPGDATAAADATADLVPAATRDCVPTGGGPHWLEEGGTVSAPIRCSTGKALAGDAFTLNPLPRGATYDAPTATLRWRTGLDAAGVYLITITARPSGETGQLKIGVADRFDDPANVPVRDPASYTEEFGLPVFHLQATPQLDADLVGIRKEKAQLYYEPCKPLCSPSFYSPVTITYRGRVYRAEGHYRGSSSLAYPKKNFTLRFPKDDKFTEPVFASGAMRGRRKIALVTTFDDNSYLRWRLAFELWNRMDPSIIKIGHYSAVVFLNGKYHGLYTVADKIDDNMMQRAGLSEEGNLYMGISHNANFDTVVKQITGPDAGMVRPRNCPFEGYIKKEGLPEQCSGTTFVPAAFDDLTRFIDFVSRSDDTRFRNEVGRVIEVKDYFNWFVHASAILATDSYAKNGLHYHDPRGGRWRAILWDYNSSFGQEWDTRRLSATAHNPASVASPGRSPQVNNIFKRLWTDSTWGPQMRARYAAALKNEMRVEVALAALEAMVKEIDASARRDERRWRAEYRTFYGGPMSEAKRTDFTTYSEEVAYVRQWIRNRWSHLRTLFP